MGFIYVFFLPKAAVVRQRLVGLSAPGSVLAQKPFVGEEVKSECPLTQEGSVYQLTPQFVVRTSLSQYICLLKLVTDYREHVHMQIFSVFCTVYACLYTNRQMHIQKTLFLVCVFLQGHTHTKHTTGLAKFLRISSFDIKKLIVVLRHYLRVSLAVHVSSSLYLNICTGNYILLVGPCLRPLG